MQIIALILFSAMLYHGFRGLMEAVGPIRRHMHKSAPRVTPMNVKNARGLVLARRTALPL